MTEEEIEIEIKEIRKILILLYELLNENEKSKKLKKSNDNLVINFLRKLLKKYVKNVRKRNLERLMKKDIFGDNKKDNDSPVILLNENSQEIRKNNFSSSVYSPPAVKNLPLDKKPKK